MSEEINNIKIETLPTTIREPHKEKREKYRGIIALVLVGSYIAFLIIPMIMFAFKLVVYRGS